MSDKGPEGVKKLLDDNPCKKEHQASLACLSRTSRKENCRLLFDAYRECMKEWRRLTREAKLAAQH